MHIDPDGSPVSSSTLWEAVKTLNTRIHNRGLSSQEILFCCDQITGEQLKVDDLSLWNYQERIRQGNHTPSSRSKAHGAPLAVAANVIKGDLVFIKSQGNRT